MSDDLSVIQHVLAVDEDDALFALELCEMLQREDDLDAHGYPKDTPRGRDLQRKLREPAFRQRLLELARAEQASDALLQALS